MEGSRIISSKQMAEIEKIAIDEGADDEKFMQRAADEIAKFLKNFIYDGKREKKVSFLIGKGNNAGDGFLAAKLLQDSGIKTKVFCFYELEKCSSLCKKQYSSYKNANGDICHVTNIDQLNLDTIVVDGIFGTGFSGKVTGILEKVIKKVNESKNKIISIDIPSGLNGNTGNVENVSIKADFTIFLGLPKIGFFINDGPNYTGKLHYAYFGLEEKYLKCAKSDFILPDTNWINTLFPKIEKNRHKYQAGFVCAIAGSVGMDGAAKLSTLAALRSGAGIVKIFLPKDMQKEEHGFPIEVVKQYVDENDMSSILNSFKKAKSIFIGPGIGRKKEIFSLLEKIIPQIEKPLVLDADGLFFLSKNPNIKLPKETILTPHRQEMLRILNIVEKIDDLSLIEKTKNYSDEKNVTIVLKGYPTFIFIPNSNVYVVNRGDPGMATAGTGDVLTGIIASLLSQGLDNKKAAVLGVYIHCLAGELAAKEKSSYSMIASDMIKFLPDVFKACYI
jgi:ADP-dependent NAD(P)H-hydrate dehydratase / NAD(P)H-hydrate epimerase